MAGLDLSSFAGMMQGSSSGPVIAPGKPEPSLLWKMIESDQMPMGGKLSDANKQLIRTYIEQGRFPTQAAESEAEIAKREAAQIKPGRSQPVVFQNTGKAGAAGCSEQGPGTNADRHLCISRSREKGLEDGARSGPRDADPAGLFRTDRLATRTCRRQDFCGR